MLIIGQVESARADRMGVSFGIDFSGSTNFVLVPSAAATIAATPATPAPAPAPATASIEEDGHKPSTAAAVAAEITAVVGAATVVTSTTTPEAQNKMGGRGEAENDVEGMAANIDKDQEVPAAGAQTTKLGPTGKKLDSEEGGGALHVMSARVSTRAFCRAVVARLTVRDPKLGGAIKVRGHRRMQYSVGGH